MDRRRFGDTDAELAAPESGAALRRLLEFEVARARDLLDSGASLVGHLHGRARLAVAGYVGGGRATLAAIAATDYDVAAGAPRASSARRVRQTLLTWRRGR